MSVKITTGVRTYEDGLSEGLAAGKRVMRRAIVDFLKARAHTDSDLDLVDEVKKVRP